MGDQDERRDIRAKIRTYKKDGEDKNFYQNVGTAWVSEHGSKISLQLDCIPVSPEWDGKLYINKPYEPKDATSPTHEFNKKTHTDVVPEDKPINLNELPLSEIPF